MVFKGVIIEESLEKVDVLRDIKILHTKVEAVTDEHQTPWVKQWTLHTVEIPEDHVESVAKKVSQSLDPKHSWYADVKNDDTHFVIFRDKVFKVDRSKKEHYQEAVKYGLSLGIPDYQLDFSPHIKEWERK